MADRPAFREAPDLEVEITPEMIEAGTICFLDGDRRIETLEEIIARVFGAMVAAKELASPAHRANTL